MREAARLARPPSPVGGAGPVLRLRGARASRWRTCWVRSSCTPPTSSRRRSAARAGTWARWAGRCSRGTSTSRCRRRCAGGSTCSSPTCRTCRPTTIALMPPEAREHEPRVTLDGGADGLDVLRRVAAVAPRWLAPGGHLLVETSEAQAAAAVDAFTAAGLAARVVVDEDAGATVVVGTCWGRAVPMSEAVDRLVALADPERAAGMARVLPDRTRAVRRGRRVPRADGAAGDGGRQAAPRAARRGRWRSCSRTSGTRCGCSR